MEKKIMFRLCFGVYRQNKNFIPTMKYQFIAGTNFTGTPSDHNKYILNETAVKAMGLKPPYVGTKNWLREC